MNLLQTLAMENEPNPFVDDERVYRLKEIIQNLPPNDKTIILLYIEYNREQHYNPIAFFGGEEKFKKQIEYDCLKKDFLKDKLLVISYLDFDKIESILESSTTISEESTL